MRIRSRNNSQPASSEGASRDGLRDRQRSTRSKENERAPCVSSEERERRRQAGLCLRCGGADHMQKICKFRSAANHFGRKAQISEAQIQTVVAESMRKIIEGNPILTENAKLLVKFAPGSPVSM